jgi:1,4-alpha-glucan branching enzyme
MTPPKIGSFALVLHSHLPYVIAHGKWPHGMDWLNEAASGCYLPILNVLNELVEEGISPQVTIGVTPILCEQLADDSFKKEFPEYLDTKIRAAGVDVKEFSRYGREQEVELAHMWEEHYQRIRDDFEHRYQKDLLGAFKKLQDAGHIEIMTCAATHGYLPLLSQDTSVQAQVKQAVKSYRRHFDRDPRGIWLPECAYRPSYKWKSPAASALGDEAYVRKGVEEFLSENGLDYFVIDSALLKGGKAIGVYIDRFEALRRLWGEFEKQFEPRRELEERTPREVYLVGSAEGKKPVAVFTRDPDTGLQVWSGEWGYPGDGNYLDFHKKHWPGGHRYWKVTSAKSDLGEKEVYVPRNARARVPENASHFKNLIKGKLEQYHDSTGRKGILCAPFDSELFGHWWFEGPQFLKLVLRQLHEDPSLELTTCSQFLDQAQPTQVVSLPEGSWGEGGYHYIWLNQWTEWTWKRIYEDELRIQKLAREFADRKDPELQDILKQAAREFLLLCASDWQFLISTWAARDYAEMRLAQHHADFNRLADMAQRYGRGEKVEEGEWTFLGDCKKRDAIFSEIEIKWFAELEYPPR